MKLLSAGLFLACLVGAGTAVAQQLPQPNQVMVCEHVDYVGPCTTFTVEPGMRHKLEPSLAWLNDKASSVLFGSGIDRLIPFEHSQFEGDIGEITKSEPNLGAVERIGDGVPGGLPAKAGDWNDIISSLIVIPKGSPDGGDGVELVEAVFAVLPGDREMKFLPLPERRAESEARYASFGEHFNDEADWFDLKGNVQITLFEDSGFGGRSITIPGMYADPSTGGKSWGWYYYSVGTDATDLADFQFDEIASSAIVRVRPAAHALSDDGVALCEHVGYVGACRTFTLEPGMRYRLVPELGSFNDKASSVLVGRNVSARLFRDSHFERVTIDVDHDLYAISNEHSGWNDQVSSLLVRRKGAPLEGAWLRTDDRREVAFFPLPESSLQGEARYPHVDQGLNDESEVLLLCGSSVTATVYKDANFGGDFRNFPGHGERPTEACMEFRLSSFQFDEVISSLVVRGSAGHLATPVATPPARGGEAAGEAHRAPPSIEPLEATPLAGTMTLEQNSNRPGHDYRNFDLSVAQPEACRDACAEDARCRAYTYVKPGVQGGSARCWLKDQVPPAEPAPCCASGRKN